MRLFTITLILLLAFLFPSSALGVSSNDLLNAIRNIRGDGIASNSTLMEIADRRAIEISVNFSHDGAGAPWVPWGEILAWNNYPEDLTVQAAIQGWLDSPGHREVLLGQWSAVGTGVYIAPDGRKFYAAIFAIISPDQPVISTQQPIKPVPKRTLPPTDTE